MVVRIWLLLLVIGVIAAAGAPGAAVIAENQQHVPELADNDVIPLSTAPRFVRQLLRFVASPPSPETSPSAPPRSGIFRPPRARV